MNEGASACAGGIAGACDKLYQPDYMWPGIALFVLGLVILLILTSKKILKVRVKVIIIIWLILAACFAAVVILQTETAGDRTSKRAEFCQRSKNLLCEY